MLLSKVSLIIEALILEYSLCGFTVYGLSFHVYEFSLCDLLVLFTIVFCFSDFVITCNMRKQEQIVHVDE